MDALEKVKSYYLKSDKKTFLVYINSVLFCEAEYPWQACQQISKRFLKELKELKPHYILEVVEVPEKQEIEISATSPGIVKNSYYNYKISYSSTPRFCLETPVDIFKNKQIFEEKENIEKKEKMKTVSSPLREASDSRILRDSKGESYIICDVPIPPPLPAFNYHKRLIRGKLKKN